MTRGVLGRLAAMQPDELRFRLACELRKTGERLACGLFAPRWDRRRLARALRRNVDGASSWNTAVGALRDRDYGTAHRAFAAHFADCRSPFPLNARDVQATAAAISRAFPGAAADAVRRGEQILRGEYDLLGYRGLALGSPPDWHADPVNGRRSPAVFWTAVPYLDPSAGDHKVIWELNRHQHWIALGRAFALSGDRRFYREFTRQLASWLAANPPLLGTNWASMLELGFRALSWLWALQFFAPAAADDPEPWLVDFLLALDRQLAHVEHNLSHYFSPNTHLSGEALALYVAGMVLPQMKGSARRAALGREVLVKEATRQVRSDGGHAELSAHYHRYSTDFYLLATAVARRAGDGAAAVFEEAAKRQASYLRTLSDDAGIRPQIGDDDGGQLFPVCGRPPADCRDTLATAAVLLRKPALHVGHVPEETCWMCGAAAADARTDHSSWPSAALPASGYYVSRTSRQDHLVFDAGPHGFLNGGHAHADALSFTLSAGGVPLLIDPGTASYTMDRELRDRFRSTMMHNSVVLDGRSQSEPRGPFHWASTVNAEAPIWRSSSDCDYMEGTHAGYAPWRHTRAILAIHGLGWWVLDHLLGAATPAVVDQFWHLHPSWHCELASPHVCSLTRAGGSLALASSGELTLLPPGEDPLAGWSPAYGVVEPAPVLRGRVTLAGGDTIATFIPAVAEVAGRLGLETVAVETPPGDGWHGRAFRVRWQGGAMVILVAVEATGLAERDTAAPAERWGTAELQTDGRVAVVIDYSAGRSETILVNGAIIRAHPSHPLVSLSRRVPLLRFASAALARHVHELELLNP